MHWFADFVLQTDKQAKNKSSSNYFLSMHLLTYTLAMLPLGVRYAVLNGLLHFVVDYCTSRATKHFYKKGDIHNFFVVVGLDQAIHMSCLVYLLPLANPMWF